MSGLTCEQLDELEERVAGLLPEPWDKGTGRPRDLTLREALIVSCGYARSNITEEIWAEIFDVHQTMISRYISELTPLIDQATEEFRPTEEEAAEATRDAIALVDGTLWPCWSWDGEPKLWSEKYKTTGHGSLIVTNLQGCVTFVSDPVTGNRHDMAKLDGSEVEKILKKAGGVFGDKGFIGTDYITTLIRKPQCRKLFRWEHQWNNHVSSFRAPVERAVAQLKTWRILFTDYRRPLETFASSFRAANRPVLLQREFWISLLVYNTLASFAPNREWLYQKANASGWADCFRDPFYPNPRFLERDRQPERETRQHSRLAQRRRLLTALVPGLPSSCGGRGQAFCKPAWAAAR